MGRSQLELRSSCVDNLPRLLEQAVPRPRSVASPDGAAALALAAHCLMVSHGFTVLDAAPRKRTSIFNPPAGWNAPPLPDDGWPAADQADDGAGVAPAGRRRTQWVFEYKYKYGRSSSFKYEYGRSDHFVMYCTLQPGAGKLFVHAQQAGNVDNAQCCALRLAQYLHTPLACAGSWDEVLVEEELLAEMFSEYIARPLCGFAALSARCGASPDADDLHLHRPSPTGSRASPSDPFDSEGEEEEEEEEGPLLGETPRRLRRHSSLDPKLQYMLTCTPPSLMLPAVLVTSAAATTAVLWAWRR